VVGSIGLEQIMQKITRGTLGGLVAALFLIPGLVGILTLHPYEYIFYNSLIGGVRAAFRNFELDYWATSYREAMEIINSVAPPGAVIVAGVPVHLAAAAARNDLVVVGTGSEAALETLRPDFGLASTRANHDQDFYPEYDVAWEVRVDGAVLAVIKDLRPSYAPPSNAGAGLLPGGP